MGPLVSFGMRTILVLLSWLVVSLSAVAQTVEYEYTPGIFLYNGVEYASGDAACVAHTAVSFPTRTFDYWQVQGTNVAPTRTGACWGHTTANPTPVSYTLKNESCPAGGNWVPNTALGMCQRPMTCAGRAGTDKKVNLTLGWTRTGSPDDYAFVVGPNWPTTSVCEGGCSATRGLDSVTAVWHSGVPAASGMHRVSGDFVVTFTGATCTPSDPSSDPADPEPPCPGFTGQVNGRPVCVGTPAGPLPDGGPLPTDLPAGSGNPAAGAAPTTGPGSGGTGDGRTPVTGSGGNEGGGSNAAIPGGGSEGNGQSPDSPSEPIEVEVCGLPGKPACRMDETGTPTGAGAYTDAEAGLGASRQAAIDGINAAAGTAGKSTGWTFSFAFPTACSPIPIAAFAPYLTGIDVCVHQPMIHDLMALVWLAAAAFCCIGMVGRAVGGGGS